MKVRMKVGWPARDVNPGDVIEVSPHEAASWVRMGNAELVEDDSVDEVHVEEAEELPVDGNSEEKPANDADEESDDEESDEPDFDE